MYQAFLEFGEDGVYEPVDRDVLVKKENHKIIGYSRSKVMEICFIKND